MKDQINDLDILIIVGSRPAGIPVLICTVKLPFKSLMSTRHFPTSCSSKYT